MIYEMIDKKALLDGDGMVRWEHGKKGSRL
jgi:hypothetical protein